MGIDSALDALPLVMTELLFGGKILCCCEDAAGPISRHVSAHGVWFGDERVLPLRHAHVLVSSEWAEEALDMIQKATVYKDKIRVRHRACIVVPSSWNIADAWT